MLKTGGNVKDVKDAKVAGEILGPPQTNQKKNFNIFNISPVLSTFRPKSA